METIEINLIFPGTGIKCVRVRRSDDLSVLYAALPRSNYDLVHRGQVIDRQCTFQCYKIQNGDSIVVLAQAARTRERWLNLTADDDDFHVMMRVAANVNSRSEFLRLRDAHRMRMESDPRRFRKICRRMPTLTEGARGTSEETVIPEPAAEMRDDSLPALW
jgi:hypothetical protein